MFGGLFIARVITARVNEHKEIFALYFGTGSGDTHPHEGPSQKRKPLIKPDFVRLDALSLVIIQPFTTSLLD